MTEQDILKFEQSISDRALSFRDACPDAATELEQKAIEAFELEYLAYYSAFRGFTGKVFNLFELTENNFGIRARFSRKADGAYILRKESTGVFGRKTKYGLILSDEQCFVIDSILRYARKKDIRASFCWVSISPKEIKKYGGLDQKLIWASIGFEWQAMDIHCSIEKPKDYVVWFGISYDLT